MITAASFTNSKLLFIKKRVPIIVNAVQRASNSTGEEELKFLRVAIGALKPFTKEMGVEPFCGIHILTKVALPRAGSYLFPPDGPRIKQLVEGLRSEVYSLGRIEYECKQLEMILRATEDESRRGSVMKRRIYVSVLTEFGLGGESIEKALMLIEELVRLVRKEMEAKA